MTDYFKRLGSFFFQTAKKATAAAVAATLAAAIPVVTDGVDSKDLAFLVATFVGAFLVTFGLKNAPTE